MAVVFMARQKRATTDLLGGDRCLMARGYASSSGTEHEALSSLVHAFFECDDSDTPAVDPAAVETDGDGKSDSDGGDWVDQAAAAVRELVRGWRMPGGDPFRLHLLSDASETAAAERGSGGPALRRTVMARLREMGYNAGLCKARWESTGNLVAGSNEYIDVVAAEGSRYIVDLGFAAQFEVARAAEGYEKVVAELPEIMVALPEEVRQVVRRVGEAARRSLKEQGLHVPPWRKGRYMAAKWLGPYRRTLNAVPAPAGAAAAVGNGGEAKCRAVGFATASGVTLR